MTTTVSTEARDKAAALLEQVGEASIPDITVGFTEHPLSRAADAQALASGIGRIVLAGSSPSGSRWVQFNQDGAGGFASTWPEWALQIARDALLHNVKVWVLSDGSPFGSNLTQVLLYAP
jgi:hypothetical protein